MAKTFPGAGNPDRPVKVDDQKVVVYHNLAFGNSVHPVCGLDAYSDALMAATALDACKTGICTAAVRISF
jgi:hypothetical protein